MKVMPQYKVIGPYNYNPINMFNDTTIKIYFTVIINTCGICCMSKIRLYNNTAYPEWSHRKGGCLSFGTNVPYVL